MKISLAIQHYGSRVLYRSAAGVAATYKGRNGGKSETRRYNGKRPNQLQWSPAPSLPPSEYMETLMKR
jgi:hypothetical protein